LQEAVSGGGGCGIPYGISIDFRLESLASSGFCQKGRIGSNSIEARLHLSADPLLESILI
jgi:hypothetical protein